MQLFAFGIPILWIFLIVNATSATHSSVFNKDSRFARRFNRAASAKTLSDSLPNFKSLARLANGISLEIGLIDGSIPSDDAIAELLHTGPVKLQEVINLNTTAIDTAITELENLPSKFKTSPEITAIEQRLVVLETIRQGSFINDFMTWNGTSEYTALLEEVQKLNTINFNYKGLSKYAQSVELAFSDIEDNPKDNLSDSDILRFTSSFGHYKNKFENLEGSVAKFLPQLDVVHNAKKIVDQLGFVQLLRKEQSFREKIANKVNFGQLDLMTASFKSVDEYVLISKSSLPVFKTLQKLIRSHTELVDLSLVYAIGLPGGSNDLEQLSLVFQQDWIADRIGNSSVVIKNLKTAFQYFDTLKSALGLAEKWWKPMSDEPKKKSFGEVTNLQYFLANSVMDSTVPVQVINAMLVCDKGKTMLANNLNHLEAAFNSMNQLNEAVKNLPSFSYLSSLTNMSRFKNILSITPASAADGRVVIKKMIEEPTFNETKEYLKLLQSDLASLSGSIGSISKFISTFENNLPEIDEHYRTVNQSDSEFFDCLNNITEKEPVVSNALDVIQKIKNVSKSTLDSAKTISKIVSDSRQHLEILQKSGQSMKSADGREALALKTSFTDSQNTVKDLALAVRGLTQINKLMQIRGSLDALKGDFTEIQEAAAKALSSENVAEINKLNGLRDALKKTLDGVKAFVTAIGGAQGSRRKRDTVGFASNKKIFEEAAKFVGLTGFDIQAMHKAVAALNPTKFGAIVSALDALAKLDLDFSKYNFKSAPASLQALDTFFLQYASNSQPLSTLPPPPPPNPPPAPQPPSSAASLTPAPSAAQNAPSIAPSTTEASEEESSGSMLWIIIGAVVVVLIILVILLYLKCMRKEPKEDPTVSIATTTTTGPESKIDDDKPKVVEQPEPKPEPEVVVTSDMAFAMVDNVVNSIGADRKLHRTAGEFFHEYFEHGYEMCKKKTGNLLEKDVSERRKQMFICYPQTMPKLVDFNNDRFINANLMEIDGVKWIMTQGPMDGTEHVQEEKKNAEKRKSGEKVSKKPIVPKKDTREKFWGMIEEYRTGVVAQLCQFKEDGENKCAEYYSTEVKGEMKFGRYTVKTVSVEENLDQFTDKQTAKVYTIEFHNNKVLMKVPFPVKILAFSGWPDHGAPAEPHTALDIIKYCESFKTNVLVHCSVGVGRTGTLVAIKYGIQLCSKQEVSDMALVVDPVRACRYGAVQTEQQLIYMLLCITKALMEKAGVLFWDNYNALHYYYDKLQTDYYEPYLKKDEKDPELLAAKKKKFKEDGNNLEEYLGEKRKEFDEKNPGYREKQQKDKALWDNDVNKEYEERQKFQEQLKKIQKENAKKPKSEDRPRRGDKRRGAAKKDVKEEDKKSFSVMV